MNRSLTGTIVSIYKHGVLFLFFICVLYLTHISLISTSLFAPDCYYLPDSVPRNLLAVVLLFAVLLAISRVRIVARFFKKIEEDQDFFFRVRRGLLIITGLAALVWVVSSQLIPFSDQFTVQDEVRKLHMRDWSAFQAGEYFFRYPNQLGLLLLSYLFSFVFGSQNYLAFQLFNAAGLVLLLRELSELCACFRFRRAVQLFVVLEGLLFFPLILYCSYVYGTILGLAAVLFAVRLECRFFQKGNVGDALLCAGSMMLALLLKSNFQIFFVGMLLASLVESCRTGNLRVLLCPGLLILALLISGALPRVFFEHLTGAALNQPMSAWGWIAMGLTESGWTGPGAWTGLGYRLYEAAGFQTEAHALLSKERVFARLAYFWANKGDAFRFFTLKLAYEWNEPSFQSFWSVAVVSPAGTPPAWVGFLTGWKGSDLCCRYLNVLQTIHLVGTCFYVILFQKEHNGPEILRLLLPLIFVGGFIFYLFWESGPRYTIIFYVLLFPFAAAGFDRAVRFSLRIMSCLRTGLDRHVCREKVRSLVPYLCILLAGVLLLSAAYHGRRKSIITADEAKYQEFAYYEFQ